MTIITAASFIFVSCSHQPQETVTGTDEQPMSETATQETGKTAPAAQTEMSETSEARQDFSQFDSDYQFSAAIPENWKVEYVSDLESINIYNSVSERQTVRDKSQIFVRKFSASDFLTLSTVTIFSRTGREVKNHPAVLYDIEKNQGVADFSGQPFWRNQRHKVLDIRHAQTNPSVFYVFSYSPELAQERFDDFIDSLVFYNDRESFAPPLPDAQSRVTKKPFGIHITPAASPVAPERFSGFHTGTDFEVTGAELNEKIQVRAVCGGEIIQRRRAEGYGGVAVQECSLGNQPITVVYGHIVINDPDMPDTGKYIAPGMVIATLGADKSADTDGERKHLHLGIRKGGAVDIRGYVGAEGELAGWINITSLLAS